MTTFPKVYTVNGPSSTSSSTLPSWLTVKPRSTKTSSGHRKRVKTQRTLGQLELVQDLAFPESAIKIKTTEDGHYAIGTGCYKPMMKVWDLDHLTVKFERVTDAENVDFVVSVQHLFLLLIWVTVLVLVLALVRKVEAEQAQILSSDWTKTLHLQRDRSLALHTQSGLHHSIRLPTYGRSLAYHSPSADALVAATGTDVFRFNLEQGRYMTPLSVAQGWNDPMEDQVEGVNVVDVNSRHGLWSFGLDGGGGVVEFWDPRSRSALTRLSLPASTLLPVQPFDPDSLIARPPQKLSVTALSSHPTDGLSLAVGTSSGHTLLYDLRSPTPFAVKDQGYGEPMKSVEWLRGGGAQEDAGRVVSADSKVIKIWSKDDVSISFQSFIFHTLSMLIDPSSSHLPTNFHYIPHLHSSTFILSLIPVCYLWLATQRLCPHITSLKSVQHLDGQDFSIQSRKNLPMMFRVDLEKVPIVTLNSSTRMSWRRESPHAPISYFCSLIVSSHTDNVSDSLLHISSAHQRSNHICTGTSSLSNYTPPLDSLPTLLPTLNIVIKLLRSVWRLKLNHVYVREKINLKSTRLWRRDYERSRRGKKRWGDARGKRRDWSKDKRTRRMEVEMGKGKETQQTRKADCWLIRDSRRSLRIQSLRSMSKVENLLCSTQLLRTRMYVVVDELNWH